MTSQKAILIWVLLCLPILVLTQDCKTFIDNVSQLKSNPNSREKTDEEKWYFDYSGRGNFDLGQRALCDATTVMKYYVLVKKDYLQDYTQPSHQYKFEETGICLPVYCTKEEVLKDPVTVQNLFNLHGLWIGGSKADLYDPSAPVPPNQLYNLFMGLIVGFSSLCLLCTALLLIKRVIYWLINKRRETPVPPNCWFLKSFDIVDNLKSLYATAAECGQSEDTATFGFLRTFGALWIVIFHTELLNNVNHKWNSQRTYPEIQYLIWCGQHAVGYFFFIGGFVCTYSLCSKVTPQSAGIFMYFKLLFHRLVRVYPGVVFATLFFWVGVTHWLSGPHFNHILSLAGKCDDDGYMNFQMINNIKPHANYHCVSWTWYIDVDFHAYFVVILLVFLYTWRKILGYIIAFGIIYYSVFEKVTFEYWHTKDRAFEVFFGVIFGLHYYEYAKLKYRWNLFKLWEKSWIARYFFVFLGLKLNWAGLYMPQEVQDLKITELRWIYVRRLFFPVGVAFIFLPFANSKKSDLKTFFNLRIFQILGKLSYGIYLFHCTLIDTFIAMEDNIPDSFEWQYLINLTKRVLFWSTVAALVFYLIVERPILGIEGHFTRAKKVENKPKEEIAEETDKLNQNSILNETHSQELMIQQVPQQQTQETAIEMSGNNERYMVVHSEEDFDRDYEYDEEASVRTV